MTKIKIFFGQSPKILEDKINDFLKDKILVDIKMSMDSDGFNILIIYNEVF